MNLASQVLIGGHKLKLLAIEVNPAIPNLGIQTNPKSVK